jgi:uncharacterized protein YbjQ (UPF0145 family)
MRAAFGLPLLASLLSLLSLLSLAAGCSHPPAAHARGWTPPLAELATRSHSTIAAILPPATPRPPPAPSPVALAAAAPKAKRAGPNIRLFTSDGADCPTEALGVVNERASLGDEDGAIERLKAKARVMGADAIVGYRSASALLGTDLAGVAVRCRTPSKDKEYDTIGELEVPARPGEEDAAFDELLARADDMHANLVIGVHVVPGSGGAPAKVVGAAIRYR